ncbi:TlpA disulfide reductase family protein [Sphingobacterium spiritivorum]|nr:TlpA disulfide reductase family protein [Sphingobacterium spiritivorum]QQT36993.1 TlpA family protein disulfide reductase [Sphingobacterium spiritivorum]WQD33761.1 TlpA disulfide reductase family protein [Sphingobacterium spiritivorum]SUJ26903.1 Thiol-disulfide oxidoreductase resA [Sphingobacterium spiritivorum]
MKKLITIVLLCAYVSAIYGQAKKTRVRVEVSPLKVDSMWVNVYEGKTEPKILKPDANGTFTFSTIVEKGTDARISIDNPISGEVHLYLEPEDDLLIRTDFKENTIFSGKGGGNSSVINELMNMYRTNYGKLDVTKTSLAIFYEQIAEVNKANTDFLDANRSRVSKEFYEDQKVQFYYGALGEDIQMPYLLSLGLKKKLSEVFPSGYIDMFKKMKLSDSLLIHKGYTNFVKDYLPAYLRICRMYQLGRLDSVSTQPETEKRAMEYEQVKEHLTGQSRIMALFGIINNTLQRAKNVTQYKGYIQQFAADGGSQQQVDELQRAYDEALKLSAGAVPPPFTLDDLNGKQVSLQDFAGKVIYIDFWASWCSPCRYEMKNGSPKLHARLADNKDVVFLYISIDDSEEKWRQAIQEDKIEGIHLLSKGGMKSVVAKAFNISGIPRYVIIGRDGRIVDKDATRPSQDITYDKIMDAVKAK